MTGEFAQIVPQRKNDNEAVFSFASALSQGLLSVTQRHCTLLSADQLVARSPQVLADALVARGVSGVLLHYVNYAYERRGCPGWLVDGLERWVAGGDRRLLTLFHEVHGSGPPWSSAFWTRSYQRKLAQRLLRLSSAAVTSLPLYRNALEELGGRAEVLTVFSTVGEPKVAAPFAQRAPEVVLFGGRGARQRVFGPLRAGLERALEVLGADSLVCIGESIGSLPARIGAARVIDLGPLPADEVGCRLGHARAGVLGHAPAFLPKSTAYAAYAAYGLLPIPLGRDPRAGDPTVTPYWSPWEQPGPDTTQLGVLAERARASYSGHALAAHVKLYSRLLGIGA